MRQFSILNLLVLLVIAGVPKFFGPVSDLDNRALSPPGCANFNGDDQHLKLYSGGMVFEMWVPSDSSAYNVGRPFARLNCNEVSSPGQIRNPSCVECWDRMNFVEILLPGACSFALTTDDKKLISMESDNTKGKNPFPAAGYLALVTCHKPNVKAARDIDDTQFRCIETHGSNITLWTGSSEYILSVPANETVFDLIGPDSTLGCVGPLGWKYSMCQACNFPVQNLALSAAAGVCAFNLSGYANLIYHDYIFGPLLLPSPTQIWDVRCGLGDLSMNTRNFVSETRSIAVPNQDLEQRSPSACIAYYQGIEFNCTTSIYEGFLAVPTDMLYYSLVGSDPFLACYFYWEPIGWPCHPCYTYEMVSVRLAGELGECRLQIKGWKELLVWAADDRETKHFHPPIQLLGIQCGFGLRNNPPAIEARSVYLPQESDTQPLQTIDGKATRQVDGFKASSMAARSSELKVIHNKNTDTDADPYLKDLALLTRENNPGSANSQCSQSESDYHVAIQTSDGSMWFAPVPLDYEFHPMSEMICARLSDGVCASCSEIGIAGSVSTDVQWGPCIFFTEDRRQFITKYWNPLPDGAQMIALIPINPGAIISGIECGSD